MGEGRPLRMGNAGSKEGNEAAKHSNSDGHGRFPRHACKGRHDGRPLENGAASRDLTVTEVAQFSLLARAYVFFLVNAGSAAQVGEVPGIDNFETVRA
jgi:hypothetical protein